MRSALVVSLAAAWLATGCAASGPQIAKKNARDATAAKRSEAPAKNSPFPSHRELSELGAAPTPVARPSMATVDAPGFELVGALPDVIQDVQPQAMTPFTKPLHDFAVTRQGMVMVSGAMHCFAKQIATFRMDSEGHPSASFIRFLAARCGTVAQRISFTVLKGKTPAKATDEEVAKRWGTKLPERLASLQLGAAGVLGAAAVRRGNQAVWVVAWGQRRVRMTPLARTASGNRITFEGEILIPAERLSALVTKGDYGVGYCRFDPRVRMPRFKVTCPVNKGDHKAWVDLAAFQPGRVLGQHVVQLLVTPSGAKVRKYERSLKLSSTAQMAEPKAVQMALVGLINGVRAKAGLKPVSLATAQSDLVQQLAGHYFGALVFQTAPETVADRIVMGLRAGWDVPGSVWRGHTTSFATSGTKDLGQLINGALELPGGRRALLSPEVTSIAVGTFHMAAGNNYTGALFATYETLTKDHKAKLLGMVVDELNTQRKARGLAPVKAEPGLEWATKLSAEALESGDKQATQGLMRALGTKLQTAARGWSMMVAKVPGMKFPEPLLTEAAPRLSIAVGLSRPVGTPWVVLQLAIAVAGQDAPQTQTM